MSVAHIPPPHCHPDGTGHTALGLLLMCHPDAPDETSSLHCHPDVLLSFSTSTLGVPLTVIPRTFNFYCVERM